MLTCRKTHLNSRVDLLPLFPESPFISLKCLTDSWIVLWNRVLSASQYTDTLSQPFFYAVYFLSLVPGSCKYLTHLHLEWWLHWNPQRYVGYESRGKRSNSKGCWRRKRTGWLILSVEHARTLFILLTTKCILIFCRIHYVTTTVQSKKTERFLYDNDGDDNM